MIADVQSSLMKPKGVSWDAHSVAFQNWREIIQISLDSVSTRRSTWTRARCADRLDPADAQRAIVTLSRDLCVRELQKNRLPRTIFLIMTVLSVGIPYTSEITDASPSTLCQPASCIKTAPRCNIIRHRFVR